MKINLKNGNINAIDGIEKVYPSKALKKKKLVLDKKKTKEKPKQNFQKVLTDKMTKTK